MSKRDAEQLAAAREAARVALDGRSPRAVGAEKNAAALRWVYRWGWSTPTTVDAASSPGRRGIASRLVKSGLLQSHPTASGGGAKGVPVEVLTLTQDGVADVEALLSENEILPYPANASAAVPWHQLRHDSLVQIWTARRLADGKIREYATPREIAEKSAAGEKQPDAVWTLSTGQRVAVELELTAKKERDMHQTCLALLKAVHPGSNQHPAGKYDIVVILSQSAAILARYQRMLAPGARIALYERDSARRWQPSKKPPLVVPDWSKSRVLLERVDLS